MPYMTAVLAHAQPLAALICGQDAQSYGNAVIGVPYRLNLFGSALTYICSIPRVLTKKLYQKERNLTFQ